MNIVCHVLAVVFILTGIGCSMFKKFDQASFNIGMAIIYILLADK